MSELSDFLLARISEDEAAAQAATGGPWIFDGQGFASPGGEPFIRAPYHELDISEEDEEHIVRWRPTRVLAECEAKRRIVNSRPAIDVPGPCLHVVHDEVQRQREYVWQVLALPYASHPDYREEWRP